MTFKATEPKAMKANQARSVLYDSPRIPLEILMMYALVVSPRCLESGNDMWNVLCIDYIRVTMRCFRDSPCRRNTRQANWE
jgi:hypothetical protein